MGEEIIIEKIECSNDCYQIDFKFTKSGRLKRAFIRKDALFALLTVAENHSAERSTA